MNWRQWGLIAVAIYALILSLGAGGAQADCSGKILHEDKFEKLDPAWNASNDATVSIESNKLVIKPPPNAGRVIESQSNLYQNVHICVSANIADLKIATLGVVFWGTDLHNFYALMIDGTGSYSVARLVNNRFLSPVGWTQIGAIKQGTNQWNQLEVDLKGNTATMFINGTQVPQFSGQPPEGGGLVGLIGSSPEKSATLQFQNFKISQ